MWNIKFILNLCMNYIWYMFPSVMWRIKNQLSHSTSWSDNALCLCGGQIILRTSSGLFIFNLGLCFEGLFWERYILKGQFAFEGHWRLQSWTLIANHKDRLAKFLGDEEQKLRLTCLTWLLILIGQMCLSGMLWFGVTPKMDAKNICFLKRSDCVFTMWWPF